MSGTLALIATMIGCYCSLRKTCKNRRRFRRNTIVLDPVDYQAEPVIVHDASRLGGDVLGPPPYSNLEEAKHEGRDLDIIYKRRLSTSSVPSTPPSPEVQQREVQEILQVRHRSASF